MKGDIWLLLLNLSPEALKARLRLFAAFPFRLAALCCLRLLLYQIQLSWQRQEPYNFLFDCLQWAIASGAIFSLAAITAAQTRLNTAKSALTANLLGVAAAVVTFLVLYLYSAAESAGYSYRRIQSWLSLVSARLWQSA
jgi:hypothetical protein